MNTFHTLTLGQMLTHSDARVRRHATGALKAIEAFMKTMKECNNCGELARSVSQFKSVDGKRMNICKPCLNEVNA